MNCAECKERMWPENPAKPFYRGLGISKPPLCHSCPNFDYEKEVLRRQGNDNQMLLDKINKLELENAHYRRLLIQRHAPQVASATKIFQRKAKKGMNI